MLISETAEYARVLVALLVSVVFLVLHLSVRPFHRAADGSLMLSVEVALVLMYVCVLLIKLCDRSAETCSLFGLGTSAKGARTLPDAPLPCELHS